MKQIYQKEAKYYRISCIMSIFALKFSVYNEN